MVEILAAVNTDTWQLTNAVSWRSKTLGLFLPRASGLVLPYKKHIILLYTLLAKTTDFAYIFALQK
jgi:hypothetical protein